MSIRTFATILLLNVMDVFSVCGGALLDRPCMVFQRVCVLCLYPSEPKYSFSVCLFYVGSYLLI